MWLQKWKLIRFISHKFHDRLKNNVDDVVDLIRCGLADSSGGTGEQKVRQDSMKCFQVRPILLNCSIKLLVTNLIVSNERSLVCQA
jgi:hypothetical protein